MEALLIGVIMIIGAIVLIAVLNSEKARKIAKVIYKCSQPNGRFFEEQMKEEEVVTDPVHHAFSCNIYHKYYHED